MASSEEFTVMHLAAQHFNEALTLADQAFEAKVAAEQHYQARFDYLNGLRHTLSNATDAWRDSLRAAKTS